MSLNDPIQILEKGGLFSPDIGDTVLGNIPTVPLISPRNFYLQSLESWVSTPAMQTQWVVLFEDFPKILKQNTIQELERITGDKAGWNIDLPVEVLTNYFFQRTIGCVFANSVVLPEHRNSIPYTESQRGFVGSPYMERRFLYTPLQLGFLENNLSFVDAILRPWSMLVSHKGLVARPKEQSIKTNIMVFQYTRSSQYLSQVPRKIWTFFDCAPVNIPQKEVDYSNEGVSYTTGIQFAFNNYQIYNTTYIPIPDLIDKFANGGIDEVLGTSTIGQSFDNIRENPLAVAGGVLGNAGIGSIL